MAAKPLPERSLLLKRFHYDPTSGMLSWRHLEGHPLSATELRWNAKLGGKEAGTVAKNGYRYVNLSKSLYLAHRIIWKMVTGQEPVCIDHINHNPLDNRFHNLRAVDHAGNMQNLPLRKTSKSGVGGVSWCRSKKSWRAYITINKKTHYLGYFVTIEDAALARKAKERELGFHPNHCASEI